MTTTTEKPRAMTAAERKRNQVAREKAEGWTHVKIKVSPDQVEALRAFARTLPPPGGKALPGQQALPLDD